jgi:hypothetical protein
MHHRLADQFREACRERRARHGDFTGQTVDGPWARWRAMDQRQPATDLTVA